MKRRIITAVALVMVVILGVGLYKANNNMMLRPSSELTESSNKTLYYDFNVSKNIKSVEVILYTFENNKWNSKVLADTVLHKRKGRVVLSNDSNPVEIKVNSNGKELINCSTDISEYRKDSSIEITRNKKTKIRGDEDIGLYMICKMKDGDSIPTDPLDRFEQIKSNKAVVIAVKFRE